jgi:hypothetical protein
LEKSRKVRSRVVITAFILSSLAWLRPASSARAHVVHSFALHPDGQDQIAVAISGATVVWAERTGPQAPWGSRANLYAEDLRARTPRLLARHIALVAEPDNLELSGRTAVWLDCRACRRTNGLPGYSDLTLQAIDLTTHNQRRIAGGPIEHPAISGRLVVWDAIVHGARLLRAEDIRTKAV